MPFLEKRDKSWSIRYREPDGKYRRVGLKGLVGRPIKSRREAEDVFARWIAERSRFAPPVSYTLLELVKRYERHASVTFTSETYRT